MKIELELCTYDREARVEIQRDRDAIFKAYPYYIVLHTGTTKVNLRGV